MLTPAFEIKQTDEFINLVIKAPYIKANDVEIFIDGKDFKLYVKPYFLRLTFPGDLVEDGRETAKYDISKGTFNINIPKKNKDEHFRDLDLLTTLLATKKKVFKTTLIEEIGDEGIVEGQYDDDDDVGGEDDLEDDDDGMMWEVEQTPQPFDDDEILCNPLGCKYGFANSYKDVFARLQNELYEVIDVSNPDTTSLSARRKQRIQDENIKFNQDHYIADFMDDDYITMLLNYEAPWQLEHKRILQKYKSESYPETSGLIHPKGHTKVFMEEAKFEFTECERNVLLQLANKDYILSSEEKQNIYLGLVDLLFAYAYNYRTTEGENTSESAWTICKISPTLSWLDSFHNIHNVILSCARRSLCYPLYRHWSLVLKIIEDIKIIFSLGKRWILRCLIECRALLQSDENKYILNELYLNDYCLWIQKASTKKILSLTNKLSSLHISKEDVDFNLKNIENEILQNCEITSESESSSGTDTTQSFSSEEESDSLDSDDESDGGLNHDIKMPSIGENKNYPLIIELESENHDTLISNDASIILPDKNTHSDNDTHDAGDTCDMKIITTGLEELLHIHKNVKDHLDE